MVPACDIVDYTHASLEFLFKQLSSVYVQIYGVIGNPVSHSRSPQLHNAAMAAAGLDSVYMPLLVDNLQSFLNTYSSPDYKGFSVTIPHKVPHLLAVLVCTLCLDTLSKSKSKIWNLNRFAIMTEASGWRGQPGCCSHTLVREVLLCNCCCVGASRVSLAAYACVGCKSTLH